MLLKHGSLTLVPCNLE